MWYRWVGGIRQWFQIFEMNRRPVCFHCIISSLWVCSVVGSCVCSMCAYLCVCMCIYPTVDQTIIVAITLLFICGINVGYSTFFEGTRPSCIVGSSLKKYIRTYPRLANHAVIMDAITIYVVKLCYYVISMEYCAHVVGM